MEDLLDRTPSKSLSRYPNIIKQAEAARERQASLQKQLPLWPESMRGAPNVFLRGALFAAIQGKTRKALKRELLPTLKNVEIRFTGWQLDQSDLDVWETVVHLYRLNGLGDRVEFSANQILKALDRGTGKSQHEWLKNVFSRLYSAGLEVKGLKDNDISFFGTLLKGARDEVKQKYIVELDTRFLTMYSAGWTQVEWSQRQKLRRKPLALWLHGWFSSHARPYPMKLQTYHDLCASGNQDIANFKILLVSALEDLRAVGMIIRWEIVDDLVSVVKISTNSQINHLAKQQ